MIDFSVAYDKLAQFETADEIANFLRGEGIIALRRNGSHCPISKWVTSCTQQGTYTSYGHIWLNPPRYNVNGYDLDKSPEMRELTPAMMAFVVAFDQDEYPDLSIEPMV